MPRNPSELARLDDEIDFCKQKLRDGYLTKATKEQFLSELRQLARQAGIFVPDYNTEAFSEFLAS